METFSEIKQLDTPCCAALGFFDGVHKGHRQLLRSMREYSEENGLCSCVFTFRQSPCALLGKNTSRSLQTFDDRISAIEEFSGANLCFAVDFLKYKDIAADKFVHDILINTLGAKAAFCGFNFRFGRNAEGTPQLLSEIFEENGGSVFVINPVCADGETVSSTRIRKLISDGNISDANALLAHPFSIGGVVAHGKENGRKVGIPTINQELPDGFVVPRFGVYASFVYIDGERFEAVTNIGVRPTVSGVGVNCETHILNAADLDLYSKNVRTELLFFERGERKFSGLDELARQISRDISHIREMNIYDRYKG